MTKIPYYILCTNVTDDFASEVYGPYLTMNEAVADLDKAARTHIASDPDLPSAYSWNGGTSDNKPCRYDEKDNKRIYDITCGDAWITFTILQKSTFLASVEGREESCG